MRFSNVFVGLVFSTAFSIVSASSSTHPEHGNPTNTGHVNSVHVAVHGVSYKAASPAVPPNQHLGPAPGAPPAHHEDQNPGSGSQHEQTTSAVQTTNGAVPKPPAEELKANADAESTTPKAVETVASKEKEEPKQATDSPSESTSGTKARMVRRVRRSPIYEGSGAGENAFLRRQVELDRIQARSGGLYASSVARVHRLGRRLLMFCLNFGQRIIAVVVKHVGGNNHHRHALVFPTDSLEDQIVL